MNLAPYRPLPIRTPPRVVESRTQFLNHIILDEFPVIAIPHSCLPSGLTRPVIEEHVRIAEDVRDLAIEHSSRAANVQLLALKGLNSVYPREVAPLRSRFKDIKVERGPLRPLQLGCITHGRPKIGRLSQGPKRRPHTLAEKVPGLPRLYSPLACRASQTEHFAQHGARFACCSTAVAYGAEQWRDRPHVAGRAEKIAPSDSQRSNLPQKPDARRCRSARLFVARSRTYRSPRP